MASIVANYFERLRSRQVVRPWALAAPVVVLAIALPLLRPLRSPALASQTELSYLATIQALGETDGLVINETDAFRALRQRDTSEDLEARDGRLVTWSPGDGVAGTIRVGERYYSDKPAVLAYLLSWPYALLSRFGWNFQHNPAPVAYVLTLLGVTLPVAGAAGLIYRMGRMFELKRPYRTGLATAVALGSGLISYSTVLNPHAPAAALVLCACACLFHVAVSKRVAPNGAWLIVCGLCASLAAVIDFSAAIFLGLLVLVIPAFRWNWGLRVGGVLCYLIGAAPPLLLHLSLTAPVTGDWRPGFLHAELGAAQPAAAAGAGAAGGVDELDEGVARPSPWKVAAFRALDRTLGALVGSKGLLSHYPVVLVGVLGIALVLRRHWPASTKVMAAATLAAGAFVVGASVVLRVDWTGAMFGPRWFIVFLPLMLFWAGAWLRKGHGRVTWVVAGVLLVFSSGVAVLGAAAPYVRAEPGQYTVVAAVRKLANGDAAARRARGMQVVSWR